MPDESRTSVVHHMLSWPRRLTGVQAAGLVAGITLSVAMLYAVSAAGDVSAGALGASHATGKDGASLALLSDSWQVESSAGESTSRASAVMPPTATRTAAATSTPTWTATIAPPPTATAPPPAPTSTAPVVRQQAPPLPPAPTSTPVPQTSGPWGLDTSPMDGYSHALFDATNRRRAGAGMAPLRVNGWLIGIARIRSQDMAQHGYFAHVSPVTGDNAFTLMDKHGVPYGWAGENLAENNYSLSDTVTVADDALWNSPPHRENILNANYTDMGIALAVDAAGMKYFTIIFTGPP